MAALPLSLTLSRATNGLTRPFFGWVSDHIGREMTMFIAFSLECVAILVLFAFIDRPALFVVLTGLVFFGWGEIFSLFPSTLTDTFGPKFAATNYGFLYIAQGVGSILGGPAAAYHQADDRKLDGGVHHRRGARHHHCGAGDHRAAIHAGQTYQGEADPRLFATMSGRPGDPAGLAVFLRQPLWQHGGRQ